jgi:hypothetical protein
LPLIAATGALCVVLIAFWLILPRPGQPVRELVPDPPRDLGRAADEGRRALAEGNFYRAVRELSSPELLAAADLTPAKARNLEQLRRQAELLSHLHGRSLQEVLHEAMPLHNADEWKARFQAQHQGKAVVFDDVVGRDSSGRPALAVYRIRSGDERARLALEDLRLFWRLPLEPPQRMLFGGRLANLVREDGGGWAFRFEPDSMVLLTDPGAVAACVGPPDADLLAVLRRQNQWLTEMAPAGDTR